jgi:hypothetical protein
MRRLGPILIAAVAVLTNDSHAQVAEPPLFAAFKAFCVSTDARPNDVKAAVETAGGRQHTVAGATTWPSPMTVDSWDLTMFGHNMLISAGTGRAPFPHGQSTNVTDCTLVSFANEDASVMAIGDWVGVPPYDISPGDLTIYKYYYQEVGSERLAVPKDREAQRVAEAEGRVWSLVVLRSEKQASVQLEHDLATTLPR